MKSLSYYKNIFVAKFTNCLYNEKKVKSTLCMET